MSEIQFGIISGTSIISYSFGGNLTTDPRIFISPSFYSSISMYVDRLTFYARRANPIDANDEMVFMVRQVSNPENIIFISRINVQNISSSASTQLVTLNNEISNGILHADVNYELYIYRSSCGSGSTYAVYLRNYTITAGLTVTDNFFPKNLDESEAVKIQCNNVQVVPASTPAFLLYGEEYIEPEPPPVEPPEPPPVEPPTEPPTTPTQTLNLLWVGIGILALTIIGLYALGDRD